MKALLVSVFIGVMAVRGYAQAVETPAPAPDPTVAIQAAQLADLKKDLASTKQQLQALAQRTAPSAKARAKTMRQGYQAACHSHGLKFDGLEIDAKTGAAKVYCR